MYVETMPVRAPQDEGYQVHIHVCYRQKATSAFPRKGDDDGWPGRRLLVPTNGRTIRGHVKG